MDLDQGDLGAEGVAKMLSSKLEWPIANPIWAASINPLLTNPLNSAHILENIHLINGVTTINHALGHMMNGWFLVDIQGAASIFRSQPLNALTLTLTSNAAVNVSIGVF